MLPCPNSSTNRSNHFSHSVSSDLHRRYSCWTAPLQVHSSDRHSDCRKRQKERGCTWTVFMPVRAIAIHQAKAILSSARRNLRLERGSQLHLSIGLQRGRAFSPDSPSSNARASLSRAQLRCWCCWCCCSEASCHRSTMSALNATAALNVQPEVTSELSRTTDLLHNGSGIDSHGDTPNALVIGLLVTVGMLASSLVLVLGYLCRKRCESAATHVCALLRPAPYPTHGSPCGGAVWQEGTGATFDQTVTVTLRDRHHLESEERLLLRFTVLAAPLPPARVTGRRQRPSDAGAPPLVAHDPGPALQSSARDVVAVRVDAEPQYLVPVARPAAAAGRFDSEASLLPHLPPRAPATVDQARRFNQHHRRATRSNSEPSCT